MLRYELLKLWDRLAEQPAQVVVAKKPTRPKGKSRRKHKTILRVYFDNRVIPHYRTFVHDLLDKNRFPWRSLEGTTDLKPGEVPLIIWMHYPAEPQYDASKASDPVDNDDNPTWAKLRRQHRAAKKARDIPKAKQLKLELNKLEEEIEKEHKAKEADLWQEAKAESKRRKIPLEHKVSVLQQLDLRWGLLETPLYLFIQLFEVPDNTYKGKVDRLVSKWVDDLVLILTESSKATNEGVWKLYMSERTQQLVTGHRRMEEINRDEQREFINFVRKEVFQMV